MTDSDESAEVNVSDHEYNVGYNKQNKLEIPIGVQELGLRSTVDSRYL